MKEIALTLPGSKGIERMDGFPGLKPELSAANLGFLVSQFLNLFFVVSGFLLFIWLLWGVFEYIFAGGDKEKLGKARKRLTWAIVGFLIIVISFALSTYIKSILPVSNPSITPITVPSPIP